MTREEIIRNLKYTMEKHKNDTVNTFDTNISLMCKEILDYLEQEPCKDCISRKEVLDTEYQIKTINGIEYVMLSEVQMKMRKLPSAVTKIAGQRWKVRNKE